MIDFLFEMGPVLILALAIIWNGFTQPGVTDLHWWFRAIALQYALWRYTTHLRQRRNVELSIALDSYDRLREERREIARKLHDSNSK